MNQPFITQYWRFSLIICLITFLSFFYYIQTLWTYKIHSLSYVKSLRETSMICFKKSTNIISWSLISFINSNSSFFNFQWIQHVCNSIQKLRRSCNFLNKFIKLLFIRSRYNVPSFHSSFMIVVNWI